MHPTEKIFATVTDLSAYCATERANGNRLVLTTVVCDLVHPGHFEYMLRAHKEGDLLVVGVDSDAFVSKIKGPARPFNPQIQRAELLSYLDFVDALVVYDDEPDLIRAVHPDVLVISATSHVQIEDDAPRYSAVQAVGCRILKLGACSNVHTTDIAEKILRSAKSDLLDLAGDITRATEAIKKKLG